MSTEESEALISQSKVTATNSPAKKIKKKIRKVVEVQLGPQTRVVIEKVIEEIKKCIANQIPLNPLKGT